MVKLNFETIEEVGADGLKGKGKLLTPAGRELNFEDNVSFNGDEMSGALKIAIANIKIKDGHRIGLSFLQYKRRFHHGMESPFFLFF